MKATRQFVEKKFEEFNRRMFGGHLPPLPIKMSEASSFLGMCVSKVKKYPGGKTEHSDFELRISTLHDVSEEELEDVIIHEMIHYFIMWNELIDTSPHGDIFKSLMRSINKTYGRNISISFRVGPEREPVADTRRKWHVIASVRFRDGHLGVKVLPRVVPKILDFHSHVLNAPEVEKVELFLHDSPFFNRYPVSTALKVHNISKPELASNLAGAHRLEVRDGKLIQR